MATEPLEHRIWIDAPVSDVWQAWVDEEKITQWFAPSAHVEPWPGGAFEVFFEPKAPDRQNTRGCKLVEVVPHEKLVFQWKGPDDFASFMNEPEPQTRVTVTFTPEGDATRLHLVHTGWGEGEDWDQAWSWHEIAWSDVLEALKHLLEESTEELRQLGEEEEPSDEMEMDLGLEFDDMLPPMPRAERKPSPFAAPGRPAPAGAKGATAPPAARPAAKAAPKPVAKAAPEPAAKPAPKPAAKAAPKPAPKAARKKTAKPPRKKAKARKASRPAAAATAKKKKAASPRKAAKKATSSKPKTRKVVKKVAKKKAARKKATRKKATRKKATRKKAAKKKASRKKARR